MTTYSIKGDKLVENARMKAPDRKPDEFNAIQLKDQYVKLWREYNDHLTSLVSYPILPGSVWEKTEGLQLGKHFEVYNGQGETYAVPLPAEQTQERMFTIEEAVNIWGNGFQRGVRTRGALGCKDFFKEKYNIDITHK